MRHTLSVVVLPLCVALHTAASQLAIPVTVAQADAEAAGYSRSDTASAPQAFFARPSAGTSDRRCVDSRNADDRQATGSLRSGEMIVRGRWNDSTGLHAGKEDKFLWLPLHGSADLKAPLVIRADRVGEPADSLRLTIAHVARGGGHMYGYPSLVSFPTPGRWLVVATAGSDWGCFILDVSTAKASSS
ncbi:MAG TPA: hypothetical protein VN706_05295 [Gemmatimonadaceae bacterium]|nr:hypothetical protein [Gemmatimonadaceae bacterium]